MTRLLEAQAAGRSPNLVIDTKLNSPLPVMIDDATKGVSG